MNYYPFHIGDYAKDTAHLSMLEDGAYRRLLDLYYVSEKPLPADPQRIHRLARALSRQEKQAVDTMLSEFFALTDDGWRHARCDTEILRVQEKSEKARKSIEARWKNERNTNVDTNVSKSNDGRNTPNSQEPIANNQIKPKVKTVSSEPGEKTARSKPASRWNGAEVIRLPVVGAPEPEAAITQEFVDEMQAAYPAVDVAATLPEIRAWCVANPQKRKTASGVYRFVQSWLAREQNRG